MTWRELGPYRGGRTTAVAGIPGNPFAFLAGTVGGGVWRTDNAGNTWRNVSDGAFAAASVGAIAVSPSHPDRIYVGTGESPYRLYMSSYGDGVYRSDDGGKTWRSIGLRKSRQIGGVAIDPSDPDTLLVAAQGDPWAPSEDRGIYRSTDGGTTWTRTLSVGPTSGARAVVFHPFDSRVAYAATWDHDYDPWHLRSGGPGSGIFKSTDGGVSWRRLTAGLPASMGKVGIAVSRVDPRLLWAVIEADDASAGLYRSEDGGERWSLVNRDRRLHTRSWYYMHVFADPQSRDGVYVLANPPTRSTDGGKTFANWNLRGWDFHALWQDPQEPARMVVGSDAGVTVSLDAGASWSSLHNQPTAQLYRVHADNAFPYFIYTAQQDNTTLAISSNRGWGGTDSVAYRSVGGGESGFVVTHPTETRYVYASSELGTLTELDRATGSLRLISPSVAFPEGTYPRELELRYAVNSPVVVSWKDPQTIFHAAQRVMRTSDRGRSWSSVSPDLTRNERSRQGAGGGPFSGELINHYGAISYLAQSPLEADLLWAGSNDGLLHLSRDGRSWRNVTPAGVRDGSFDSIEPSPHGAERAYAVLNRMRFGDYQPHIFRTDDFGRTWSHIASNLPEDTVVRVVREDPERKGLLFAGTERGLFISYDDGGRWTPARANLPVTPITDMVVRRGDLVISTQGRGLWSLDNIEPLRQSRDRAAGARLLRPRMGYLGFPSTAFNATPSEFLALPHPPLGVQLDVELPEGSVATIEIVDQGGNSIRKLPPPRAGFRAGLNRMIWDLRTDDMTVVPGAFDGVFRGPRVGPGRYSVRLTVGGQSSVQPLTIALDPRLQLSADELAGREQLLGEVRALLRRVSAAVAAVRASPRYSSAEAREWEAQLHSPQLKIGQDRVNFGGRMLFDLAVLWDAIDTTAPPYGANYRARLDELTRAWDRLEAKGLTIR